eukprot:gnl/TRDRNA2_/TRDRNA2_162986_c0_seq8.p1 gnl/TRDRNA2_/TRDRNA2_162986_c0~~gnl/TRDRNA2_/TRDRNA2_162986_c0_seq8.p1  ORF type:complete len:602 (+),score=94.52 gnl/TRDRNA2_/TRDRNA2_162986_c0_seq8:70-1875(+)
MSISRVYVGLAQLRSPLFHVCVALVFSTTAASPSSNTCEQGNASDCRHTIREPDPMMKQESTVGSYDPDSFEPAALHLLQTRMSIARPSGSSEQTADGGSEKLEGSAKADADERLTELAEKMREMEKTMKELQQKEESHQRANQVDPHRKTSSAGGNLRAASSDEVAMGSGREKFLARLASKMLQKFTHSYAKPRRKKTKKARRVRRKATPKEDSGIKQARLTGGTRGEERNVLLAGGFLVSMFYVAASLYLSCRDVRKASDSFTSSRSILGDIREDPEHKEKSVEKLDEDTSGLLIFSIIEDGRVLAGSSGPKFLRISRVVQALCLQAFTMFIQITSLYYIKWFCSAKSVFEIRKYYDQYELHMVGDNASLTTVTINGGHRALDQYFNESYFHTLEAEVQEKVCDIPLSQPNFFMIVLFLWSLTCILDFRRCLDYYLALMMTTPSIKSMKDAVVTEEEGSKVVVGITVMVKHIIFWLVLVPRFLLAAFMLWLGCRWLAATVDFADLILNACALEFLLCLRGLLYNALVPEHTKIDIQKTDIRIPITRHKASVFTFLSSGSWGVMAFIWIWVYMFKLQTVLPEYRWDVRAPCTEWMSERYW